MVRSLEFKSYSLLSPSQDFLPEPLEADQDITGFRGTPNLIYGDGGMVYWKDCPSVTLVKSGEDHGRTIDCFSGKGRLAKGYILIFIGEGGKFKQD